MFLSIISIFLFGLYFQKDSKKRFVVTEKVFLRIFANLTSVQKRRKKRRKVLLSGRFRSDLCGFMPIFPGKDALLFGKRCLCLPEKVGSFSQDIRYFPGMGGILWKKLPDGTQKWDSGLENAGYILWNENFYESSFSFIMNLYRISYRRNPPSQLSEKGFVVKKSQGSLEYGSFGGGKLSF